MTFKDFWEVYEADVKPKLKYNTWCTKEYVVTKKILPYFKEKKMNDISARDVIQWQKELLQMEGRNGKMYSGTYLKTVQAESSCIFNHAVNFYELACNSSRKAGPLGCGQADEMLFWTKEEYLRCIPTIVDKPYSYYAFELLYCCGMRLG
ncbi:N-terminal phage integrase SAM-like domain-containing protein [[Clostridium] fimetarium]|uniref:Phage integrase, N-terminal SAM-like domain n=1 Tax=[Clostridium] fimetarium TaxID=99656 RepID=A0A1I0M3Z8_9FIRM|nr:N-terminal phage integrase SAM-like domain-containing protein [[Clostridium] fimetarium]SEV83205.1 Phage integrase, N-terminal SAM-like domain [[Clostridium] fimetarium]